MPIKSTADGRVLGTFGTYFRDERQPTRREIAAVRVLAAAAARALDRAPAKPGAACGDGPGPACQS